MKDIWADVVFLNTAHRTPTRDNGEKQILTKSPTLSSALVAVLDEKSHTLGWAFT